MTIGVFGHVALGMATRKFWDAASKDTGDEECVTILVDSSETDPELVGPLIAFGGMLSLASLDGGESSAVGRCKECECEEVVDDDNEEG